MTGRISELQLQTQWIMCAVKLFIFRCERRFQSAVVEEGRRRVVRIKSIFGVLETDRFGQSDL
jgi:hypothetical protein